GLFWIDAGQGASTLREQYYHVLRALDETTPPLAELDRHEADIWTLLERAIQRREGHSPVLVVIDDVGSSDGQPLSPADLFPPGAIQLWTSRRQMLGNTVTHRLSELSSDEAVEMLTRGICLRDSDRQIWGSIAGRVGGLPIALDLLNLVAQCCGLSCES